MTVRTRTEARQGEGGPAVGDRGLAGTFKLWFAVLGGIGTWMFHLVFLAGFARYTCNVKGTVWILHAVTAAMAALTLVAMALSWQLVRRGGDDEAAGDPGGRTRFLGVLGLIVGGVNLALILLEGSYVIFLNPCGPR